MNKNSGQLPTWAPVVAAILIVATVGAFIWFVVSERGQLRPAVAQVSDTRADDEHRAPIASVNDKAVTAWQLAHGLDTVLINDILLDAQGTGVWLATDRGLAHVDAAGRTRKYRHFSSPNERVRRLVRASDGIALTLQWPQSAGGGQRGATALFDPLAQTYRHIGPYLRALVGHEGNVYGVAAQKLVRLDQAAGARMSGAVKPKVDVCRLVQVTSADNALWLAHQGRFRRAAAPSNDHPCGVVRLRPQAEVRAWDADNGLISGHARAIVADDKAVYVAHGIKADGLSVFDLASRQWRPLHGKDGFALGANVLGLSPTTVWLGTPDAQRPLVWVDRETGASAAITGVPENHFVSAIAATGSNAWVAWSAKEYDGSNYTVNTWLARVRDPNSAQR